MKITIEQPVIINVEVKCTWARLEALKKEFKNARSVSEKGDGKGFTIQFDGWSDYALVFANFEKRVQAAINAGDAKDLDYNNKRVAY